MPNSDHGYKYSYIMCNNFIGCSYMSDFCIKKCYLYTGGWSLTDLLMRTLMALKDNGSPRSSPSWTNIELHMGSL